MCVYEKGYPVQIIVLGLSLKIGEESKHGSVGVELPRGSTYANIEALMVKPSELGVVKFTIAPFLQHESHVKCHPCVVGVGGLEIGGAPIKAIGND